MTKETIDKINGFTRRKFSPEELYVFSVILCDNDIDRDYERFSDKALEQLKKLFVGRTGIFDHAAAASNQNARIFETELVTDDKRRTSAGEPYTFLKASAYMVRTDNNRDLIAEIDGGIKKEVSISFAAAKKKCSVCGCDKTSGGCSHVKGRRYGENICHTVLDDITDAYEWSFVAVPAQVNAGVTKRFTDSCETKAAAENSGSPEKELRREIRRLAFISGGKTAAAAAELSAREMNTVQLAGLKKAYERLIGKGRTVIQLAGEPETEPASAYKL